MEEEEVKGYRPAQPSASLHNENIGGGVGRGRLFVDVAGSSSSKSFKAYEPGYSPVDSPQKYRPKPIMPSVLPELLHLIDSAIMGKPESLDKLRNIVSGVEAFGSEKECITLPFSVVDSLLATMGGVESFEEDEGVNPPSVMLNSRAAIVAGELIPWLPCVGDNMEMSPRTRMVRGLLAILRACTRNRAMCSAAGLLHVLLNSAERIFMQKSGSLEQSEWEGTPLCYCIQHLAGHSLSVIDLRRWLEVISRALNTTWASPLMIALEKAVGGKESKGPVSTFEFDGESSGLLGPSDSRWPFSNGYAFATWIYIESFADSINTATTAAAIAAAAAASAATAGKSSPMSAAAAASALAGEGTVHMPRLFSFLSADNQGFEAYFHAQFLVVECGTNRGKKASLHFTHPFKPQCWYFVGLEHTCKQGILGKGESDLRLYIDGSLYETRPFEFPRISKPLAFCCIGTNPPPTMAGLQRRRRQCPLFAEMGPVYIFKEPIGPDKMSRLASRGGDMLPSFGTGVGLPWLATNDYVQGLTEESLVLDAELAGSLHLLYHPKLLNGRYCPDASPSGASGSVRRPAEVLGHVHVASRIRPVEAFWAFSYGGPLSLLPLTVTSVKKDSLEPEQVDLSLSLATTALAAPIFRIIAKVMQHSGNNEEICRARGPELLSRILTYLLQSLRLSDGINNDGVGDEELVAAIVSLCQSQKFDPALKLQLFRALLLDLKLWSLCKYGLQKKLLSSLADKVFTESSVMRDANAIQMLLDGCRRCYWIIREKDSVNTFSLTRDYYRPIGEVNALIDELLVIIELLMVAAPPSLSPNDMRCLLCFMVDCPQPNQVSRALHLIYRLVVQPNASRAHNFAEAFVSSGGVETLLVLFQREAKIGDQDIVGIFIDNDDRGSSVHGSEISYSRMSESSDLNSVVSLDESHRSKGPGDFDLLNVSGDLGDFNVTSGRPTSVSETSVVKNVGGIKLSISADNARNNVYNFDKSDGVVVGIIRLLGTLVSSGYLKFNSGAPTIDVSGSSVVPDSGGSMFEDKVSLLLFALQKAFQAAPRRLMTSSVYTTLMSAAINATSNDDGLNLYDSEHQFEHLQLLLVLLRSLPYASLSFQSRALQDILFLACTHRENKKRLTMMEEWPEWLLEVLISNYERYTVRPNSSSFSDVEELIYNFLTIMLQHSMRQKDGWKDIEATIHCAEWLCMIGGSSAGEQRVRREESLPRVKRRLLGCLLDFTAKELQAQAEIIAAASAGVAAECSSPRNAKAEAENAAQLSVALVENAIVILMLVEDHLRLQSKLYRVRANGTISSRGSSHFTNLFPMNTAEASGDRKSLSGEAGLPLDVLASMADENGQISSAVMEKLTAAAAAEPYESVFCAFVSYGSCTKDLAEGWKYRSRLWYGVGIPSSKAEFGGGANGWEAWNSVLEKDVNGNWIELPLINKSVFVLQALLLHESGHGGGLGIGEGSGTGMGGMTALYQLLDSDQPFLCMLRMVLLSLREEDNGGESVVTRNSNADAAAPLDGSNRRGGDVTSLDDNAGLSTKRTKSALLWSVLSPILNMPVSEPKRQRVLVACCVFYSEVWHAVGKDKNVLRRQYVEAIMPPFVAVLRRWRPLLMRIHELAPPDGPNPLIADDRPLATDTPALEAALAMISPEWAAAFASPPAAMALAMIAAGASGGDTPMRAISTQLKRDFSLLERKQVKLHTFSSFQKPLDASGKPPAGLKDKAAAKAAALAAARDLERNAKIGSGRGLGAIAMATSAQRRNAADMERVKRWTLAEAMSTAWMECLQPVDTKSVCGKDFNALSYKFIAVLVASFALARNIQRSEIDRRSQVELLSRHHLATGRRAWKKLIHYLIEMNSLFGPFADHLCNPEHVFWKLDYMESSSRMRRFLRRNYRGSAHVGAAANYEGDAASTHAERRVISASDASTVTADAIAAEALHEEDEHVDNRVSNEFDGEHVDNNSRRSNGAEPTTHMTSEPPDDVPATGLQDVAEDPSAVAPGYVPSERDERIMLELPCSMVRPLTVVRGTFQITTKRVIFIAESIEGTSSSHGVDQSSESRCQEKNRSWLIASLHQIYSRRYLLRRSALELFMLDRSNYFFDFGTSESRRNAYRAIIHARPPHLNNIYLATQRPDQLLKRTQLMERWARWEISNFEYLMQLNTLAGRSYNDITQYPVFPWILSDYTSQKLDLSNPSSYRDLSKPVGALNPQRLKKFQERYSSFDDPVIPKFHYGSHYSSAGTVLYYLVRLEPFTTLSIQLQGGKFDHADRMFSDIAATWDGVVEDMSDLKELVPELFYVPETLTNENSIDFGTTQLGKKLDSVKLPPWAENSVDFIHKHRMALESEHVSSTLHEWIDLIFGYKQRGKEAIAANNVFFYITYEGTVDIDKISDPVQRRATQDQIAFFGQTPSQLLTVPHMKRMTLSEVLHMQTIFCNPKELKPYAVPMSERCNLPASAMHASSDTIVVVDIHAPAAFVAQHKWKPNTPDGHGTPFVFQHGKATVSSSGALLRILRGPTGAASDDWHFPQAVAFPTSGIRSSSVVAITCDQEIVTGGHVDNSVRIISADGAKTLGTATVHCAPVTCVALSSDSKYLVTGSRDTTVLLWRLHRSAPGSLTTNVSEHSVTGTPTSTSSSTLANMFSDKSSMKRIEGPIHVLRGHLREVVCCCVSSDLGIVVSSSQTSDVLLHSIRRGRLIRRLVGVEAQSVCLSSDGIIMAWNQSLHSLSTFTINGALVARVHLPCSVSITCMEASFDGKVALIGVSSCSEKDGLGDDRKPWLYKQQGTESHIMGVNENQENSKLNIRPPSICFLDLYTLKVLHTLKLQDGQDITAVALNKDHTNLLVSTMDKQLIVFTDPALSLKVVDQMLKLGWEGNGLSPLIG